MQLKKIVMLILIAVVSLSLWSVGNIVLADVDLFDRLLRDQPVDKAPSIETTELSVYKDERRGIYNADGTVTVSMNVTQLLYDYNEEYNYGEEPEIWTTGHELYFKYRNGETVTANFSFEGLASTEVLNYELGEGYDGEATLYIDLRVQAEQIDTYAFDEIKVTYKVGYDSYIGNAYIDISDYVYKDNDLVKPGRIQPEQPGSDEQDQPEINETDDYFTFGPLADNKIYYIKAARTREFVLKYEELPIYFTIDRRHEGVEGTYIVSLDQQKKEITFMWHHESKRVGYVVEHNINEKYNQYGAVPVNMVEGKVYEEAVPLYIIYDMDLRNGSVNEQSILRRLGIIAQHHNEKLKNAFLYSGQTVSYNQQRDMYVFVNNDMTYNNNGFDDTRLVVYKFEGVEAVSENAGALEGILTRFMAALGDVFLWVIRLFLGSDLTIDRVIFNEYAPTVIDFESGRGWFAAVLPMLQPIYDGLTAIAVAIYFAALLYIGLTILLSIGNSFRQRQYVQHLTNWIIGLALLFVVPLFFKYIPMVANAIIGEMKGQVTVQYTYYNIGDDKLLAWGFTQEKINELRGKSGEDTATVWVEALIGKREEISDTLDELKEQYGDARGSIKSKLNEILSKYPFLGLNDSVLDSLTGALIDRAGNTNGMIGIFRSAWGTTVDDTTIRKISAEIDESGIAEIAKNIDSAEETIASINEIIPSLQHDLMGEMRALAGETGRFAYVVVWYILIFQMIVLLCMYYRRVIVMLILMMIYPLVAATYPFDKLGDGKSQSISLWFKEFVVNITVQIAHAIVYVLLVETGKQLYIANSNNWLFFVLAVLFLFPAERIMRSIFGMQGSTMATLKANVGSAVAGTAMAVSLGKNAARAANQKFGITKGGKKAKAEKEKKEADAKDQKKKRDAYLQGRADQKERIRSKKRAARRAKAMYANKLQKAGYEMMNIASQLRSGAYRIGNAGRKLKGTYRKAQNSAAMKYAGMTFRGIRGAVGMAYGATEFVNSAGAGGGLGTSFATSVAKGRIVGGFREYGPTPRVTRGVNVPSGNATSTTAAPRQSTSGSGSGTNSVSGGTRVVPAGGSTGGSSGGSSGTTRTTTNTRVSYTGETPPTGGGTPSGTGTSS